MIYLLWLQQNPIESHPIPIGPLATCKVNTMNLAQPLSIASASRSLDISYFSLIVLGRVERVGGCVVESPCDCQVHASYKSPHAAMANSFPWVVQGRLC